MAELGELVVHIKADAAQYERELKRVQGTTQQQTGKMAASFAGLKAQLVGIAPALSVAALVSFGRAAFQQLLQVLVDLAFDHALEGLHHQAELGGAALVACWSSAEKFQEQ